jgi:hypothetical protein
MIFAFAFALANAYALAWLLPGGKRSPRRKGNVTVFNFFLPSFLSFSFAHYFIRRAGKGGRKKGTLVKGDSDDGALRTKDRF